MLAMNLAAELHRRGHEVFVFNQRAELIDPAVVARLLPPAVKVLSMTDKPWGSFVAYKINALQHRLGKPTTFYIRRQQAYLVKCLRHYRIELVSSHSTYSDNICAPVVKRLGIPMVITEHGEYSHFLLDGRLDFAPILREAKRILTVSHYCQHNLEAAFVDLPPMETVYNGVVAVAHDGQKMRQELEIPAEAFVFGMVSRGIEQKGWKYAVQAFWELCLKMPAKEMRLVLVGGSAYLKQLQTECTADANIIFTGQVPNPDFYIAGFDVGLLPTCFKTEALPLAVIEYMVCGKPSIATRVGGVPELLEPPTGSTGLLVDMEIATSAPSVPMLTAAMQRYCTEPELYEAHRQNCQRASSQFTMENCAVQYEHAFELATNTKKLTEPR